MGRTATLGDQFWAAYARTGWRGFDRLWRLAGRDPQRAIRARTKYGSWLDLKPYSYMDRIALREGYYESEVLDAMLGLLEPGDVLWDVGANIGLHSATICALRPDVSVVSFEPNPALLGDLRGNLLLNGRRDSQVVTTALSDVTGFHTLHIAGSGNTGTTSLSSWPGQVYAAEVTVATATGDDLVKAGLPSPNLIKIDIEGHEAAALRGLSATLRACRAVIFEDGPGDTEAKAILAKAGFAVEKLYRRERSSHALENYVANRA